MPLSITSTKQCPNKYLETSMLYWKEVKILSEIMGSTEHGAVMLGHFALWVIVLPSKCRHFPKQGNFPMLSVWIIDRNELF